MGVFGGSFRLTSAENIRAHKSGGSWRTLEKLAVAIVNDAAATAKSEFKPVLGGGTRLMLALEHRISDDIDLFIRDPQWIGYITPRLNDSVGDGIDAALTMLGNSPKSQLQWAGIRAPMLPDLHSTIVWAQDRLNAFRGM